MERAYNRVFVGVFPQQDVRSEVHTQVESGNTPLHRAIEENQEAVFDALLSEHDVEIKNNEGVTPLMLAVIHGKEKFVEKLIEEGATVDCEDSFSNTPLLLAVKSNHEVIVGLLLQNGAFCDVENNAYESPLLEAISMNSESIVDKLIEAGADVNIWNKYATFIEVALASGKLNMAKKLLNAGAFLDPSIMIDSVLHCYSENIMELIDFVFELGLDVNAQGYNKCSLLHVAITRLDKTLVENLLKRGANVNAKDRVGETPLHYAARLTSHFVTKLLLEYKCDVNVINEYGQTALYFAVRSNFAETVRLLLNAGADMNIPCSPGDSLLDLSLSIGFGSEKAAYLLCVSKMDLAKVSMSLLQNDGSFPKNFTNLDDFKSECLEELNQIKAKRFGEITLYNVFSECNDPIFASNSDMEIYLKSKTFDSDFPLYGGFLRRKFVEGVKRNSLLDKLSLRVRIVTSLNVTHVVLPAEMSRKVLVYLEDCDLLNVERAFDVSKEQ